ncbi:MAG: alkaline phosphatase [Firmicutes bacterium HGW-Firmicutes-9]|jgi:alkaline phosphatase|nr:MAG: alkaline phosphatase [Firmicutes bacterium HGW-Firmicutes-9]
MNRKRLIPLLLALMLLLAAVPVGFAAASANTEETPRAGIATPVMNEGEMTTTAPKYVFLFIGDGMTYPQFQATSAFLSINKDKDTILTTNEMLNFMKFPVAGSATTFDSTSFCPDSASTATSIASGHKTYSGVLNMNEAKNKSYTTIAETLKAELGYKIGIVSSVNLNHATPAAFYAHQASRNNYYEIGLELIDSNFDYFAGGALLKSTGNKSDNPQTDLYELAAAAGYTVVKTQAEAQALAADTGKALVIAEDLADSNAMTYEIDRTETAWALKDYVQQGVTMLNNDKGFFMMVEGGKIDWACHANDAGSTIHDTLAFADAVQVAIDFAAEHPDETLILVTGDHETGGLSIGFAGTNYSTYLKNINYQTISYAKYDADYVAKYVENKTPFADAMADVTALFGLVMPEQAESAANKTLVLTDYEVTELEKAYDITLKGGFGTDANGKSLQTQEEYVQYGTYTPFSVTVTHLLNNKSGINFSSYSHTGLPAAVYASGVGQELFMGGYDNTELYYKMAQLLGIG